MATCTSFAACRKRGQLVVLNTTMLIRLPAKFCW